MELIHNHNDFLVFNKSEGIDFHNNETEKGFFTLALEWAKREGITEELFPLHRLDKVTSGLIIFAKTKEVAATFGKLFEEHKIEKFYLALSDKKPKKKQGTITGDMDRSRRATWKLLKTKENPAVTQFVSYGLGDGIRLFLLRPLTGKTHQLRVALKSLGSPIIGDPLYHSKEHSIDTPDRTYLHAAVLRFNYKEEEFHFVNLPVEGTLWQIPNTLTEITTPWNLHWPKVKHFKSPKQ